MQSRSRSLQMLHLSLLLCRSQTGHFRIVSHRLILLSPERMDIPHISQSVDNLVDNLISELLVFWIHLIDIKHSILRVRSTVTAHSRRRQQQLRQYRVQRNAPCSERLPAAQWKRSCRRDPDVRSIQTKATPLPTLQHRRRKMMRFGLWMRWGVQRVWVNRKRKQLII